jgi:hypothetical protein
MGGVLAQAAVKRKIAGTTIRKRCRETCASFGRGFMDVLY